MENKKAQNLSITTIILIILGVIVLVMLIVGVTMGWSNIKDWIAPSNNVQQIVSQCGIACAAGSKYDYCFMKRELKSEDENLKDRNATCYSLNKERSKYGIAGCSAIVCGILDSQPDATYCAQNNLPAGTEVWYLDGVNVNKAVC